ncbi:protein FAM107B-like isoform X2 [Chiloscyllium plagiosum]|uniref:protein FAM107B-like isoform X2 n=1 Tax=Chiloscyllium plagiosum TaxID=36176 RepID=UPI001CB83F8E|nr:protein FAM107B-like isoform X2 [Chiloscyllium plagiosum]
MSQPDEKTELITPKKLNNPMKDSKSYRDLHRELIFIQKRGVVLQNKPELQQVMEQRKCNLPREQEKAKQTKTDFEEELKKRYQKLEQVSTSANKLHKFKPLSTPLSLVWMNTRKQLNPFF